MFHPKGPSFFELVEQALSSTERGYDLLAPKFDYTPFRTPDEILEVVRRGWLPEQVEGVSSKYRLEGHPPLCAEIHQGIERIRRAPIVAVHNAERRHRGSVDRIT